MNWARSNGYVVFTHDLDFGSVLAATQAQAPSVIQVRTQDVLPAHLGSVVVTVDESRSRVRVLPLAP